MTDSARALPDAVAQRSRHALEAANFSLADVRDGLGPFLGVFLIGHGWGPGEIGTVMTIGGLAGMVATAPFGALVDASRFKRGMIVAAAIAIIAANMILLATQAQWLVAASQIGTGIAAAAIGPAMAGLTLGLVGQAGLARQLGRNEAWNHAGNAAAAIAAGGFGYVFGLQAVFYLMMAMAMLSIATVLAIAPAAIDHSAARGGKRGASDADRGAFLALRRSRPLQMVAITLALFHFGNAAMLPMLGQSMVSRQLVDPAAYTALTVVIAQATMIPVALWAARIAHDRGFAAVFIVALVALPLRALVAVLWTDPWAVVPMQILDGVAAGALGVATPGIVARILNGTGHINVGLGAVMTIQAVGAAFSATVAGWIAQIYGFHTAFAALGVVAGAALLLWLAGRRIMPV